MNDYDKSQEINRGMLLLEKATKNCNFGVLKSGAVREGAFKESVSQAIEALNIFRLFNDDQKVEAVYYLLKGIEKKGMFDVKGELRKQGMPDEKIFELTKQEIGKLIQKTGKHEDPKPRAMSRRRRSS